MRYFCCLASLLLLQIAAGFGLDRGDLEKKSYVSSSSSGQEISVDKARLKRSSHTHGHRGQRQVGYFETSGDVNLENDFGYQDMKDAGLRDEEKLENDPVSVQNRYENTDKDSTISNSLIGDNVNSPKFQSYTSNDHLSDYDPGIFRTERQIKRFDSSDILRMPEKPENKNYINLLKWSKNKDLGSDIFPPGVQKNEAYPVNDDVADFAIYMNKGNRRRSKSKGVSNNNPDGKYDALIKRNNMDYKEGSENPTSFDRNRSAYSINFKDDSSFYNGSKVKKDTNSIVDDLVFSESGPKAFNSVNYANAQRISLDPYPSLTNLLKSASAEEGESEQEISETQESSAVVGDVIREKTIILPEPLVFNTSHIVSSFVYTMIPFRSPLLNLLENDKHSKYIMIKIDPVLQQSKRINSLDQQLGGRNTEYALEQNVMKVIDKLIGSDLQWDLNSVEGLPRSKQKSRVVSARHHRGTDEQSDKDPQSSALDETKHNSVIS